MPRVLIIADDLTGATDTAHVFAECGYRTTVQVNPEDEPPETTVLAVNTDSRYADPETASKRVRRTVSETDAGVVYKKVDSTLRGNVRPETQSAMGCGFDVALFVPASPVVGRLTAAGYHLVDGRLLTDTEYVDDPNAPSSAHLPTLFADPDHPSRHLGIGTVAAGSESVREAIAEAPPDSIFTCDAVHDRHLGAIAQGGRMASRNTLYVGSAGLAEHVTIPGEPDHEPRRVAGDGGALGVVGSVSERSLEQLAALPEELVIVLDPEDLLADPEGAGREAGRRAAGRLAAGEHAVLTAAPDREAVERTLTAGDKAGFGGDAVRTRVARALASATHTGVDEAAGLFVTGGDVAIAVFDALDAHALSLSGEAVEAGIPVSRLRAGPVDGLPVVTKAGGFGDEETVINCLRYLGGDDD